MVQNSGQAVLIAGGFSSANSGDDESVASDSLDLRNFENLPAREVPVSALTPGPFLRQAGTNAAHVQLLVNAADSAELPPILVQGDSGRVIDGLHRLAAAKLRGEHLIRARFLDCTDSEALVLAMKANSAHGLPLSRADRMCGAKQVLTAHPDWSDRAIAGVTGLSAHTIAALRDRSALGEGPDSKRLGRDGRRRPATPGDEGRRRAAEYLSAHPDAPLRQVARETDVSLGTVHDVSARLRRGISPERNGHRNGHRAAANLPPVLPPTLPTQLPAKSSPNGVCDDGGAGDAAAASRANGAAPRRRNYIDAPPTWAAVASKMACDPTVRYTEGGKQFLRWMTLHANDPGGWREFVNSIPSHWADVIAPIAEGISKEWGQFAEGLKTKQEAVS